MEKVHNVSDLVARCICLSVCMSVQKTAEQIEVLIVVNTSGTKAHCNNSVTRIHTEKLYRAIFRLNPNSFASTLLQGFALSHLNVRFLTK